MMLNFRQIEAFRAVMLAGSMTQAARVLCTTQPNVSRIISQLESRLRLKLFDRVAGKLVPTREGEVFFRDVELAFAGLRGLEQAAATLTQRGAGHLRLIAAPSLALRLMPEAMRIFSGQFPQVTMSLQTADSVSVCRAVATGQCDLGVTTDVASSPGVGSQLINEGKGVCIFPSSHRFAQGDEPLRPEDLAGERFLSFSPQESIRQQIDSIFAASGDQRKLVAECHFGATLCQMVASGMGVSIANSFSVACFSHLALAQRRFLPDILFPTYLIYPISMPSGLLAKAFSDTLRQTANQLALQGRVNA